MCYIAKSILIGNSEDYRSIVRIFTQMFSDLRNISH